MTNMCAGRASPLLASCRPHSLTTAQHSSPDTHTLSHAVSFSRCLSQPHPLSRHHYCCMAIAACPPARTDNPSCERPWYALVHMSSASESHTANPSPMSPVGHGVLSTTRSICSNLSRPIPPASIHTFVCYEAAATRTSRGCVSKYLPQKRRRRHDYPRRQQSRLAEMACGGCKYLPFGTPLAGPLHFWLRNSGSAIAAFAAASCERGRGGRTAYHGSRWVTIGREGRGEADDE
jgi:hypothetical protein